MCVCECVLAHFEKLSAIESVSFIHLFACEYVYCIPLCHRAKSMNECEYESPVTCFKLMDTTTAAAVAVAVAKKKINSSSANSNACQRELPVPHRNFNQEYLYTDFQIQPYSRI